MEKYNSEWQMSETEACLFQPSPDNNPQTIRRLPLCAASELCVLHDLWSVWPMQRLNYHRKFSWQRQKRAVLCSCLCRPSNTLQPFQHKQRNGNEYTISFRHKNLVVIASHTKKKDLQNVSGYLNHIMSEIIIKSTVSLWNSHVQYITAFS